MTAQEIIEGNELIAEFMGGKYEYVEAVRENWVTGKGFGCRTSDLKYLSSWDAFMPAWKKAAEKLWELNKSGKLIAFNYKYANTITLSMIETLKKVEINNAWTWLCEAIRLINKVG